jgi:hypothetical protein
MDNRATTKLFDYAGCQADFSIYTHKGCVCNEKIALEQRHQVDDGTRYTSRNKLRRFLRPIIRPVVPTTEEHIISRCAGGKKLLMTQAQETLESTPIKSSDGDVKMFLKDDKYHDAADLAELLGQSDPIKYTPPRCIQYRNKRYCLRLATYLHAIEQAVYQVNDISGTPTFAKSRNQTQRGEDLHAKWQYFANPKALLLDHSKFDAHVGIELLELEHWYYNKCIPSEELRTLLSYQLDNKGYTKNGTRYRTAGTRMSGDQNTGLGNSLINYALLRAFCSYYKLEACYYIDGDDSVIIINDVGKHYDLGFFEQFGMKTKLDSTLNFSDVEFCQCRPVFDGTNWRLVRNPYRMLARMPWTVKDNKQLGPKYVAKYLASIGRCEVALGMGLPIGQFIGQQLARLSNKSTRVDLQYVANREYVKPRNATFVPPSNMARESYAAAWGIPVEQQLEIERWEVNLDIKPVDVNEEHPFIQ